MTETLTLLSPCKLNLFLYITGRRPDGYHNLQTLFTILDYGDEMSFTVNSQGTVNLQGPFSFPPEQNSISKALNLLKEEAAARGRDPKKLGMDITVIKRIPEGGGLGGGSSNAATALMAADALWGLHLGEEKLLQLGLKIGADVPIFIKGRPCFAAGVGEELTPVDLPERWYVTAAPENCRVNTKEAFADPELKRDSPVRSYGELLAAGWHNDFTDTVVKKYAAVGHLWSMLVKYAPPHLSGSGASCFLEYVNKDEAQRACTQLQQMHRGPVFLARSVKCSPVVNVLRNMNFYSSFPKV